MPGDVFVDTNVLVYAHDRDAGGKYVRAKQLLTDFWQRTPLPWISVQVLQEVMVTLQRKGVAFADAWATVEDYMHWRVVENDVALLRAGKVEMKRWQLSLWDGLILAAARRAGATTLWSEDFSDDQNYGGVRVVNPFRAD